MIIITETQVEKQVAGYCILAGAEGLSEQMVFEFLFESVQRTGIPDSRGKRIPEGGGCVISEKRRYFRKLL